MKIIRILLLLGCTFSLSIIYSKEQITIIGLGRLGLCTALCLEQAGFEVLGVDIVSSYVDSLNNKTFVSNEPHVNEYLQQSTHFKATISLEEGLNFSDLYFIIIDTPSSPYEAY